MSAPNSWPGTGGMRAYWIGSVAVWVLVWLGTGVALRGSGQFGKVLPILVVGNLLGLAADGLPGRIRLLDPAVVWAAMLVGVTLVLGESPYLLRQLAVIAAGAVWFVGVGPGLANHRNKGRPAGPGRSGAPRGSGAALH
jgi:hypothetical protein